MRSIYVFYWKGELEMNFVIPVGGLKEKVAGFIWQHILLVASLFIMTFGVALCVRSSLGSSVISTIPFVLTLSGEEGLISAFTIGQWTYVMNFVLVFLQFAILRRRFEPVQLFQLLIGFLFGWLLDVNMSITSFFEIGDNMIARIVAQCLGCAILGVGIAFEIRCGSITMPGEGLPAAISKKTGMPFAKAKIIVDMSLVAIAVALGYYFFSGWVWAVVGPGTLFAMIFVGAEVKWLNPHMAWFDKVVCSRPGFRRYLYGLARGLRYLKGAGRH